MNNDTCMLNMEYLVVLWTFKTPKVYNNNEKLLTIYLISFLVCFRSSFTNRKSCFIIIERKTFSLLATRSNLVKVFRFHGRPYCYSYVSFPLLLLLRSSVFNGRPYCYSSVSFSLLLLLLFFLLDFSEMRGRIFMKFSGMVDIGLE